ncbi:hypothetical protein BJ138DRAFT_1057568 [Hygrophoropsis aurantiaca]|uniref:Uncharacterized protein n=1 Tax=Hygrophoropsis aurantiaca TaxID=72124 RepID=A0ACB8AM42_9AGAM|nr:hypothetical protein BJ138DRAFT_1057568 [Hygrophoropsis aurantiaca]
MSFVRPASPPPPMPSPQLIPTPLPSPPSFTRKPSRSRLTVPAQHSPPIPPSLIGSPLLRKTLNGSRSHERLDRKAKAGLFGDDDEFGTRKSHLAGKRRTSASASPPRPEHVTKRSSAQTPPRYRSPPPSPAAASPPPPVPPIPAFMLTPTDKKSVLQPSPKRSSPHHTIFDLYMDRSDDELSRSHSLAKQSSNAVTCMQFFTMHNPPQRGCRI